MIIVTMGGVVLGLFILIRWAIEWWPGVKVLRTGWQHAAASAAPFIFSWCFGALCVMTVGGVIGMVADVTVWGGSWAGDMAGVVGVGAEAGQAAGRGGVQALTNGGKWMVLLIFAVWLGVRSRKGTDTSAMHKGLLSGTLLGLSGSVLGKAAVPLASITNTAAAWVFTGGQFV